MRYSKIIHLAEHNKKLRVRKKNKHRIVKLFETKFNRRTFELEGCLGIAKDVVFHEYEQPEERYVKYCEDNKWI